MSSRKLFISSSIMAASYVLAHAEFYTPAEDLKRIKKQVIPHDPNLPNVLLVGDSISIAYTPFVMDLMKGKANVARPKANCGSTERGIKDAKAWVSNKKWQGEQKWDIIHFNFGLHDLCYRHPDAKVYGKRDKINGTQSVSLEQYEANLEQIIKEFKTQAKTLIFANTTKVPEGEAGRYVGDDVKYNKVAEKVMLKHQIKINNLHELTSSFDKELFTKPGDVHFTPDGSFKIAKQVVKSIETNL